jgi:predicted nucleic acid-binding Zn ribbon protein
MTTHAQALADWWEDSDNRRPSTRRPAALARLLAALRADWLAITDRLAITDWLAVTWVPRTWWPQVGEPMAVLADPPRERRS